MVAPYRTTPVFDENSLPAALRGVHQTKAGVWGLVRVLAGSLRLTYIDPARVQIVTPETPGLIEPEQRHQVEPLGAMRMQVEFYDAPPR